MTSEDVADQISVTDLKNAMDSGEHLVLLDVREPHELKICALNYTLHIPMGDLRFRLDELEPFKEKDIVVYCRSGRRSNMAAMFLAELGFKSVKNLSGGVLAWSDQIDPTITKY
mgnify:CR=1 FL=1